MFRRTTLLLGLITGAAGIAILWAAGVDFPVAVPPGILILLVGAGLVAAVRRSWADAVGAGLGLFVIVGFILSGFFGDGFDNLLGNNGAAVAFGQVIQLVGVSVATVSGAGLVARRG